MNAKGVPALRDVRIIPMQIGYRLRAENYLELCFRMAADISQLCSVILRSNRLQLRSRRSVRSQIETDLRIKAYLALLRAPELEPGIVSEDIYWRIAAVQDVWHGAFNEDADERLRQLEKLFSEIETSRKSQIPIDLKRAEYVANQLQGSLMQYGNSLAEGIRHGSHH